MYKILRLVMVDLVVSNSDSHIVLWPKTLKNKISVSDLRIAEQVASWENFLTVSLCLTFEDWTFLLGEESVLHGGWRL